MWSCPKCGEKIEDRFDSCWKCTAKPESLASSASKRSGTWLMAFVVGILFELVLVLLVSILPNDSWLFAKAYNLLVFSHYLFLGMVEAIDSDSAFISIFLLILVGLGMACVWAALLCWGGGLLARGLLRLSARQRRVVGYSVGLLSVGLLVPLLLDAFQNSPRVFESSPSVKASVEGNTAFALDVYGTVKDKPGNLFFSPFSISTALVMIHGGARGGTETEIAKSAHFALPQEELHAGFGELIKRMDQVQRWGRITLRTANSIWCQQNHPFTSSFLRLVLTRYQADARLVDLRQAPKSASEQINSWVERKTKGRITGLVDPHQITPDTSLILCNAIYFKGRWAVQFKSGDTAPAPFSVTQTQMVDVPMMHQTSEFRMVYGRDDSVELLELPYSGHDLSMIILLPHAVDGLADLEKDLNTEMLKSWLSELGQAAPQKISVFLPRFMTSQSLDLVPVLKSIGMSSAFDTHSDFSGVDGSKDLFISDAVHKAFVEVNEAGTEAAAVTLMIAKSRGMTPQFVANHPFIFLIRENATGSILFLGRMVDPTK